MDDLKFKPFVQVLEPFSVEILKDLQQHVKEVRRIFDWPGIPYHDDGQPPENLFNRWFVHNLPLLKHLHYTPEFVAKVSGIFGRPLKPSYCFLSMYGPEGVCPVHTDRPQCQFTVDVCINSDGTWPINIDGEDYVSQPGHAVAYSGTGQVHFRKPMKETGDNCTFMDLGFFHFVPIEWQGKLD